MLGINFRKKIVNLYFSLTVVAFAVQLAPAFAVQTDRRLEIFLEKYDAATNRILPMGHPDSPFYRYHRRDFEEGLDKSQRVLLREAQEKGNCILAYDLVVEGFTGLFPFLKPAFADKRRRSKLTIMIFNSSPPAMERCSNHSSMSKLFAKRRRQEFPPVDFAEQASNFDKWQNETEPDLKRLRMALQGFGNAALCDDYRPSITDLLPIVNQPSGLALTPEEELYLVERARLHNVMRSDYEKTISRLSKHFKSEKLFLRLRNASRVRKLEDIAFMVKGHWQVSCRNFERFRRKE